MFLCVKHGGGRNFFGFNCAGFGAIMPLTELPGEKWRSVHAVTLDGMFYGVKHLGRRHARTEAEHEQSGATGRFEEAPGLVITVERGARFWALDAETCERALTELQAGGFLVKSADGHFRRRPTV